MLASGLRKPLVTSLSGKGVLHQPLVESRAVYVSGWRIEFGAFNGQFASGSRKPLTNSSQGKVGLREPMVDSPAVYVNR